MHLKHESSATEPKEHSLARYFSMDFQIQLFACKRSRSRRIIIADWQ